MQITINTDQPLSDKDRTILTLLLGDASKPNVTAVQEPAKVMPLKPSSAPAKKATASPAKKAEAEPTPSLVEDVKPAEDEDLLGDDTLTKDDIIARAVKFVDAGRAQELKAALATVGASRVKDVKPTNYAAFLQALGE